jgi:hypothetical protein
MTEKNRLLQINTIPLIHSGFMSSLMTHLQIIMIKIKVTKYQKSTALIIVDQHQFESERILVESHSA